MADEHIIGQLYSDTNVIGYKPKLEYKKERTATGEAIISEENQQISTESSENDSSLYTRTLNGFIENTPSNLLEDIEYVLKNIDRLKNKLAERFNEDEALKSNPYYKSINDDNKINSIDPQNDLNDSEIISKIIQNDKVLNQYNDINKLLEAGKSNQKDFADKFEKQYNNINGSVIPALINHLTDLENQLNELRTSLKTLYYDNPNISTQESKEKDAAYISNLKTYERNNQHQKINYLTLSFDALFNKTISYSVFQDNKCAIKVAKVIDSHDQAKPTENDMDIVKIMFDEIEKELDIYSRGYMRNEELMLTQKSLYNYYEKRKILNDAYSLFRKNPESKFLGRKVTKYENDLNNAIKNVNRVLLYNQNYFNKITDYEKQKYILQKL